MNERSRLRDFLETSDPSLFHRLHLICEQVQRLLARVPATFPEYTEHGWPHALSTERLSYVLFGDKLLEVLTPQELFLLVVSCWFHDVGMVGAVDEDPETVRKEHPVRSAKYLANHYQELNLSYHEAIAIGKICCSHGEWDLLKYHREVLLGNNKIKLRLLCCLLGLSDVCDVTSDRAPEIVYKLVKPGKLSDAFWKTHLDIGGLSMNSNGSVWLTAEYKSDRGKRLIEQVISLIDKELECTLPTLRDYGFQIEAKVEYQIDSVDPRLTDISFQRNLHADNILPILTKSLYKRRDVFVRELLQNAVDACRIRAMLSAESESYIPQITLHIASGVNARLTIVDNGIGMDLFDVENYLSIPGARPTEWLGESEGSGHPDTRRLIARFGIGILSCFLCGESVEFETKKHDSKSIRFLVDDLNSKYGFLDSDRTEIGTTITVLLESDFDAASIKDAVLHYLRFAEYSIVADIDGAAIPLPSGIQQSNRLEHSAVFETSDFSAMFGIDYSGMNQLTVCQEGILISDHMNELLPDYAYGIQGTLNLKAGVVELTASRTEIEEDDRYAGLKELIGDHIVSHLTKTAQTAVEQYEEEQTREFLNHLLKMNSFCGNADSPIGRLITRELPFETLAGKPIFLRDISEGIAYYVVEDSSFLLKRCKWLGKDVFSRLSISGMIDKTAVDAASVLYFRSDVSCLGDTIRLVKEHLATRSVQLVDITEIDNFLELLEFETESAISQAEKRLEDAGIQFALVQTSSSPVIDLGEVTILNTNTGRMRSLLNALRSSGRNVRRECLLLANAFMLAQRFDLAYQQLILAIGDKDQQPLHHGYFETSPFEYQKRRILYLFKNGRYEECLEFLEKCGLDGELAEDIRNKCVDRMTATSASNKANGR